MTTPREISIEIGLRFTKSQELEFFGIDDVNSAMQVTGCHRARQDMDARRQLRVASAELREWMVPTSKSQDASKRLACPAAKQPADPGRACR